MPGSETKRTGMLYDTMSSFGSFTDSLKGSLRDSIKTHGNTLRSHGSTLRLHGSNFKTHALRRVKTDRTPEQPTTAPEVVLDEVPIRTRYLFAKVGITNITDALSQVTIGNIVTLLDVAQDQELNASTIEKLYESASSLPKFEGRPLQAAALVICIILILFPMGVANPILVALGFHHVSSAVALIGASLKTMFGAKAIVGLMQGAISAVHQVTVVQGTLKGVQAVYTVSGWLGGGTKEATAPAPPPPPSPRPSLMSRVVSLREKLSAQGERISAQREKLSTRLRPKLSVQREKLSAQRQRLSAQREKLTAESKAKLSEQGQKLSAQSKKLSAEMKPKLSAQRQKLTAQTKKLTTEIKPKLSAQRQRLATQGKELSARGKELTQELKPRLSAQRQRLTIQRKKLTAHLKPKLTAQRQKMSAQVKPKLLHLMRAKLSLSSDSKLAQQMKLQLKRCGRRRKQAEQV